MRVGAIDVGTNSLHLLVAEISADGHMTVIEKTREQVELGSGGLTHNRIQPDAFERGVAAMASFRSACDSFGTTDITAAATSAVREAENGSEFVRTVREQTGIHIRTITGKDEARLIWLGARNSLDFSRGRVLLMDLGGGSTEFILCDPESTLLMQSTPLGHIRLSDAWVHSNPLSIEDEAQVRAVVRKKLEKLQRRLTVDDFGSLVATSGAIRCLARVATNARGDQPPAHGHGLVIHRAELDDFLKKARTLTQNELANLPGMDARRKRTIAAAAIVVGEVLDAFELVRISTSERSLRDGLLVDWVLRHRPEIDLMRTVTDPRRRSVLATLDRYQADSAHARQVADIAKTLFDETAGIHGLRISDRRLLEFSALLHDVGHHIAGASHNRHSGYLIRHTRMYGFTSPEIDVIANVARYHRGSVPKKSHKELATLSPANRQRVRVLSGLLRLADALDRGHEQNVIGLTIEVHDDKITVRARTRDPGDLERWAARRRTTLLREVLGRPLDIFVGRRV